MQHANMYQCHSTPPPGITIETGPGLCFDDTFLAFAHYVGVYKGDTDEPAMVGITDRERGVTGFAGGLGLSV